MAHDIRDSLDQFYSAMHAGRGRSPGIIGTNAGGRSWPIHSDAAGVHPSQIAEAKEESRRLGVPTDFDNKGCAVLTDPAHRKRYARAIGLHDRRGGYGDP
jgi:hypothetical protein